MRRTTIMLPERLKAQAEQRAREDDISLGELIRRSLREAIERPVDEIREDPLFADSTTWDGDSPVDLAADHDRYLYDETP